jgi:hypothetical protein
MIKKSYCEDAIVIRLLSESWVLLYIAITKDSNNQLFVNKKVAVRVSLNRTGLQWIDGHSLLKTYKEKGDDFRFRRGKPVFFQKGIRGGGDHRSGIVCRHKE